ncbi:hypothetical protein T01_2103 [Trichinella spiralis]|uniref:Uncharacterized protein n=1 Tax=Trichinella spiralis TaxID=6334 RepID=A0A0V1BBC7_TRISP|nr:hypothetical protein T01_2103 [Trichinella spiralis]
MISERNNCERSKVKVVTSVNVNIYSDTFAVAINVPDSGLKRENQSIKVKPKQQQQQQQKLNVCSVRVPSGERGRNGSVNGQQIEGRLDVMWCRSAAREKGGVPGTRPAVRMTTNIRSTRKTMTTTKRVHCLPAGDHCPVDLFTRD